MTDLTPHLQDTQAIVLLLGRVSVATKKIEDQYRETGMAYNIFKVSGIGTRDTSNSSWAWLQSRLLKIPENLICQKQKLQLGSWVTELKKI